MASKSESKNKTSPPVLIVGAGPTGLVLALWLKHKGIEFRIIDKSSKPGTNSRALAVQARTLEFYRQLGIANQLIDAGITVQEILMRRSGNVVGKARIGAMGSGLSPFPYLLFCAQDIHEALLTDILLKMGVTVERESELVDFQDTDEGVIALIVTPKGQEKISVRYLCGCDGAHSTVRHRMGVKFSGGTYKRVFFVADVVIAGEPQPPGVQLILNKNDFCIVMPIKAMNSVRLVGLVPIPSENKEHVTYEDVADSVAQNTGLKVQSVNWFSKYSVHHRVAEHFCKGRVFLLGDAGHIHSPAGGQGMNTGIGDAVNLAWKLAEVLEGHFSAELLQSYEPERMAFAKSLIKTTDTAFRLVAGSSFVGSLFRAYIIPRIFVELTKSNRMLTFAFKKISQIQVQYRDSFLSEGGTGNVRAGDRLPWIQSLNPDNFESLKSLNWQVHVYGEVNSEFRKSIGKTNLERHQFPWSEESETKGLMKSAVYVIRPDGHIGWINELQDAKALHQYFHKIGRIRF